MIDTGRRRKKTGSRNIWICLLAVFALSSALGMGAYYGYRYYCESVNDGFLKGTYVDGEDVTGLTVNEAKELILGKYADSEIIITENGKADLKGNLAYYGYEIDEKKLQSDLQTAFENEKSSRPDVLKSIFDRFELRIEAAPQENTEKFEKQVSIGALAVARYGSEDALLYFDKDADKCVIKDEIEGNEIEEKALQDYVRECVRETIEGSEGLKRSFEFPWDLCVKPKVYRDDAELVARRDAINQYAGAGLTYTFGDEREEYDLMDIADLFLDIEGGKAQISDEKIEDFVKDLASRYNTRYLERRFESTLAGEITIAAKYNDYGYTILEEDEMEAIRENIESREHVEREPVYLEKNSWGNPYYLRRNGFDDLDGTYIEVDLTAQHVWYYKGGELYTESDCVSGDVTDDHGTQTGCFPLAYKESPSVLTGGEGDGEYEEEVQYWMPFFEGQGLHDASWRYNFGGSIYRGNGSHGCVNLPVYAAGEIYEAVETGTAIIIFYE